MIKPLLIIKTGALGDMALTVPAFETIRKHHPHNPLYLLTRQSFEEWGKLLGLFDKILIDPRLKFYDLPALLKWRKETQTYNFERVYDLQMVQRTNLYRYLIFRAKTPWCGSNLMNGDIHSLHPSKRYLQLFKTIGIDALPPLNLKPYAPQNYPIPTTKPYVLVVPGTSQGSKGKKKWPLENFVPIIKYLEEKGFVPIILGGAEENYTILTQSLPSVIDLAGKTRFGDILDLALHAKFAIGLDTGPMHLIAGMDCPVIILHDPHIGVNPPASSKTIHITSSPLENLNAHAVIQKLEKFII